MPRRNNHDEESYPPNESSPLLRNQQNVNDEHSSSDKKKVEFSDSDEENPRNWPRWRKLFNVMIVAFMAIVSPLASSMFTPAIQQVSDDLGSDETTVVAGMTSFVVMLGIGPLILAPLSETYGRRIMYLTCYGSFSVLQIPTALSPNVATLIAIRAISGFFGSVGIANGGGSISDMFAPQERATVFGVYLTCVLLGPAIGPLIGGIATQYLGWRWIFWICAIMALSSWTLMAIFLKETYAPTILQQRKKRLMEKNGDEDDEGYEVDGEDKRPLFQKITRNVQRPLKILFCQPIVTTMATYQAIIFATMYTLYTRFQDIFGQTSSDGYGFSTTQVGLVYLGPGLGFLAAAALIVPYIDTIFNKLTERNDGKSRPEFRLPLAAIGSLLMPASLFAFAWMAEYKVHWFPTIAVLFFYGLGQVLVFNTVQNYYVDAFEKYAASAIAAGAFFRSLIGGLVPLAAPPIFDALGDGWAITLFGFVNVLLAPSPYIFWRYGPYLRERFTVKLE